MCGQLLFTTEQAADLLSISPDWLRRQVAAELAPCTRLGRAIRFSRPQLEDIISRHAVGGRR